MQVSVSEFNPSSKGWSHLMFGRRKALGRPNERREIGIGRAQRHGDGSSPGLFLIVPLGPQVQRDIGFRVVRGLTGAGEAPSSKAVRRNLGSRARTREV